MKSSLLKKELPRTTRPESQTLPSLMESLTLKTMPGRRKSKLLMDGQRERMTPAKLKLQTSRTLLSLKTMLAKLPLPILITLQSLRMMVARLTLLLSMPEQMLKLLPEMARTRLSMIESARRFLTVKLLSLACNQDLTHRMMRELQTLLISRLR